MGSMRDWIRVAELALVVGGVLWLTSSFKRDRIEAAKCFCIGILLAISLHFEWRALQWPLICVTVPLLSTTALIGWRLHTIQTDRS